MKDEYPGKTVENRNGRSRRLIAGWSRWLHIYLSMFSFAILFFFAVTGITLNHTEWFDNQQKTYQQKGNLEPVWINVADSGKIRKLEIVEFLRKQHQLRGAVSDFIIDEKQLTIAFSGPGYSADVFIDRESGAYELSIAENGFFGLTNDLHKGRDTGAVWACLIDISALLMIFVSLTGLVMLFFLKKKKTAGLLLVAIGILVSYLIYVIWVP